MKSIQTQQRINYSPDVNLDIYNQMRVDLEQMGYPHYAVPIPVAQKPEPVAFSRVIKYWLQKERIKARENTSAG